MEKNVSEAIKYRRSVRRFDKDLEIDDKYEIYNNDQDYL